MNNSTILLNQSDLGEAIDDLIRKRKLDRLGGYRVQFRAIKTSFENEATIEAVLTPIFIAPSAERSF